MTNAKPLPLRALAIFVSTLLSFISMNPAYANQIKKQNFFELLTHTESIIVGTVTKKEDGFQNGLPYTEISLDVGQNIKGHKESTFTFRQFGLIEPKATGDGRINLMVTPAGWPTYSAGEQVMLFLHKPAAKTGFQTTVGLTQGKFVIRGDKISNGLNNEELFSRIKFNGQVKPTHQDLINQKGGSYSAQAFLSLVKTAVQENWIENGVMTNEK